jgi:hypothetical protein
LPAEGDRQPRQGEPGKQAPDRRARLLRAEGQSLTVVCHLALQQRADGWSAERVRDPSDQEQRRQARHRLCQRGDRDAGSGHEPGRQLHTARRPHPVDEPAAGDRQRGRHHVEQPDGEAQVRVAEGEVGPYARREASRQEAGHDRRDDQGGPGDERTPSAPAQGSACDIGSSEHSGIDG